MFKKVAMCFGLVGVLAFAASCGDDSEKPKTDGSSIYLDGGTDLPVGYDYTVYLDGNTQLDTGPSDLDCAGIVKCFTECTQGDTACQQGCVSKGTSDAQAKFNAYAQCLQTAGQGTCQSKCSDPQSKDCLDCLEAECKNEIDACMGGGGPPEAGFGDFCDSSTPCQGTLTCFPMKSSGEGFCTKQCSNTGQMCTGSPAGTQAFCIFPGQTGGTYCGFLCKADAQTWSCPSTLQCATEPNPPGSTQFPCEVQ
jgi:hypothetical protein